MRLDEGGNKCPETLGEYRDMCFVLNPNSKAVEFLDKKIKEDPSGRDAKVFAEDSQMRFILFPMILEEKA